MTATRMLNTAGLGLVIIGCVLLYCFGLPPSVNPSGQGALLLERIDMAEVARGKRYRFWGRIGIGLVGVGSALQVWAVWA